MTSLSLRVVTGLVTADGWLRLHYWPDVETLRERLALRDEISRLAAT